MAASIELANIIASKTNAEIRAEYEWIAKRMKRTVDQSGEDYPTRMHGEYADALILYIQTGLLVSPKRSCADYDLIPVMNLYRIAPPHVKERIDPIVSIWKGQAYKSPDLVERLPPKDTHKDFDTDEAVSHCWIG